MGLSYLCLDFDGHHSGGNSFDLYIIFLFCNKMWAIPTSTSSALKKIRERFSVYGLEPRTRFGSSNRVGPGIGA